MQDRTEDDQVAVVLEWLRRQAPHDLRTELGITIDRTLKRTDICIFTGGELLVGIIEIKSPQRFRTEGLRGLARRQVEEYAEAFNCRWVGWTDGIDGYVRDRLGDRIWRVKIIAPGRGLYDIINGTPASPFRLGLTLEQISSFPSLQRSLTKEIVDPRLYLAREVAGFSLATFLASAPPVQIIAGEPDVGKSTFSHALAAHPAWNALYIDGGSVQQDLDALMRSQVLELYGIDVPVSGFLEQVAEESSRSFQVPFGVVVDAFDELFSAQERRGAVDLAVFIRRVKRLGGKVVVITRPNTLAIFRANHELDELTRGERVLYLGRLEGDEFDRFAAHYLEVRGIGGRLEGTAREVCRVPGMLDIITQTYSGKDQIDPHLTERELYDKYREQKLGRIQLRSTLSIDRVSAALHRVAAIMLQRDQFAIPYYELEREISPEVMTELCNEEILVSTAGQRGGSTRFKVGSFRDFLLSEGVENVGDLLTLTPRPGESNE